MSAMSADNTVTATEIDKTSIKSMSFCPTTEQVGELIAMANIAEKDRKGLEKIDGWRTNHGKHKPELNPKLISKLYHLPDKLGLCPDSLNPNDTVLAKLGRGCLGDGNLRVINDLKMPFGADSCGPNGVLTNITNNRINLFYKDIGSTKDLLNEYILFRDENLYEIFKMFVEKIKDMARTMKLHPEKEDELDGELQEDYNNVKKMFEQVLKKCEDKKSKEGLEGCGIGCVSFCQTWLRKTDNPKVGEAQFSVMSPHFQTRFHVINDEALKTCGVEQKHINSYIKIIKHFDNIMSKGYGREGGGPAFVHLDDLKAQFDKDTSSQTQTGQGKRKTKKSKRKTKKSERKTKKSKRKTKQNKGKRKGGKSKRNRKKTKKKRR